MNLSETISGKQRPALIAGILIVGFSWLRYALTGLLAIDSNPLATLPALLLLVLVGIPVTVYWMLQTKEGNASSFYVLVLLMVFAMMPPFFSNDIFSFWAYGQAWTQGFDPYSAENGIAQTGFADEVSFLYKTTPCVYGPVALYISSLSVSIAGDSPMGNFFATKLILLLFALGCWIAVGRVATESDRPLALAVLVHPLALIEGMGQAHTDIFGLYFVLPALLCWKNEKYFPYIPVLLALAVCVKITFVFALPLLFLQWKEGEGLHFQPFRKMPGGIAIFLGVFILIHSPFLPEANSFFAPFETVKQLRPSGNLQDMLGELAGLFSGEYLKSQVLKFGGYFNLIISIGLTGWIIYNVVASSGKKEGIVAWGLLAAGTVLICFFSHRFFSWYLIGLLPLIYLFQPPGSPWIKWIALLGFFATVQSFSLLTGRETLFFKIIVAVTTLAVVILQWLYFRQRFLLKQAGFHFSAGLDG